MNDDITTIDPAIELGNDDLASARGGLTRDPGGDPGGPTGHPDSPLFQIPPGKIPDFTVPPPYRAPSDKQLPGAQTPPIIVIPVA
jgi:hypothetical protein